MFIHIFIKIFNNKGIVIPRILSQLKNTTLSFVKCVLRSKMRHLRRIYIKLDCECTLLEAVQLTMIKLLSFRGILSMLQSSSMCRISLPPQVPT